uniref:CSON003253 protein n=1 Tax=Culicoides sonorensis TaxID=179676 RepID=A0A336L287_CULSO
MSPNTDQTKQCDDKNNKSGIVKSTSQNIDVIKEILDNCRVWQLRSILIIYLTKIPTAFFMACIVYSAPVPERVQVYCKDTTETNSSIGFSTIYHPAIVDVHDQEFSLSLCDTRADIKEHAWLYFGHHLFQMPWIKPNYSVMEQSIDSSLYSLMPCDIFDFKSGNPVTSYDILCSRGALVVLTQGMHLVGIFLSGIVARYAMKATSPKTVLRSAMLLQIVCGTFAGLVGSLVIHLVFRALAAIGCAAAFTTGSVIFSDITNGKLRIASQVFFDIFWSIGIIILSFITQYEARWTQLYFIISYPTLIIIFLTLFLPDSPSWLLRRGKLKEVQDILITASNSYKSTAILPANLTYHLQRQSTALINEPPPSRWFSLWRGSLITSIRNFSVHVAFSCFTIMYFGMVLNMASYGGRNNLPRSARFLAGSEIIGCCLGYFIAVNSKIKFMSCGVFNLIGSGIALSVWYWKDYETEFVQNSTLLYFCLVLKASVSCSYAVLSSCTTDLVSSDKKAILLFSSVLCGRLWLLNAPVMVSLGTFYGEFLSLTLFAMTGCFGGLAMILIDLSLKVKGN